jgi:hypothetical protein
MRKMTKQLDISKDLARNATVKKNSSVAHTKLQPAKFFPTNKKKINSRNAVN